MRSRSQSRPVALFFADAHLDTNAWANRPTLVGDSIHAFKYICNYAVRKDISTIVGAGDLIDVKKPPPEVVQVVRSCMSLLYEKNVEFFFIQGQHEFSADTPWFCAIHEWPTSLNGRSTTIGGKSVFGLDWRTADKIAAAFASIPKDTDILVAHQVWLEFMGEKCGCEASFTQVPIVNTIFTGDFHVNKELDLIGADGQPIKIISPGSTNIRKIDECTDKYFYLLLADGTWQRKPIPGRRKFELTIASEKDLQAFPAAYVEALEQAKTQATNMALPRELAKHMCRIKYISELEDAYKTIKATVKSDVELFLKPVSSKQTPVESVNKQTFTQSTAMGLLGMLETVLTKEDVRYVILSRLLSAPTNMKLELQRLKKERGLV